MSTVGSAIVTCPACGESIPIEVWLGSVTVRSHHGLVDIELSPQSVRHECKGRA